MRRQRARLGFGCPHVLAPIDGRRCLRARRVRGSGVVARRHYKGHAVQREERAGAHDRGASQRKPSADLQFSFEALNRRRKVEDRDDHEEERDGSSEGADSIWNSGRAANHRLERRSDRRQCDQGEQQVYGLESSPGRDRVPPDASFCAVPIEEQRDEEKYRAECDHQSPAVDTTACCSMFHD